MALVMAGQVGPQVLQDGVSQPLRQGKSAELIAQELHGRFYEQCYRGSMFGWGKTITALSANSISLNATTTPIIGVWNPITSPVNLVILQAAVQCVPNNLTSGAGPGVFVWAASVQNGVISTGNVPWNRKTLQQSGSSAKAFDLATALTGLTNNLVIFDEADFVTPSGLTYTTLGSTAVSTLESVGGVQNFDGSLIVPPGGVLALLNTTSSTAFSATARLMWEEVAV